MRLLGMVCSAFLVVALAAGPPTVNLSSPTIPADVAVPADAAGNPTAMLPYFDDYSWQAFLAMVWPAASGQRGTPDLNQTAASGGWPRVFETYKATWEVFHADATGKLDFSTPPADWNQYDQGKFNACQVEAHFGDLILASFSKYSDMGQASFVDQGQDGPLIAQNGTYVHYETGYSRLEFNQIQAQKLYLPATPDATFPFGSVSVKSAWMEMKGIAHPERYYVRDAWVLDPDPDPKARCHKKQVGLIGLHIVQKTPTRQQWIWSSFEQVDNVPEIPPDPLGPLTAFALNGPGSRPMGTTNPYAFQAGEPIHLAWPPPIPYNVERLKPIHRSTQTTNLAYRKALRAAGSVWQYYQLVMTQFPIPANQAGIAAAAPSNTFPGEGRDSTAFANTTMETFNQTSVFFSCMACHNSGCTDFVCSLKARAQGRIHPDLDQLKPVALPPAARKR